MNSNKDPLNIQARDQITKKLNRGVGSYRPNGLSCRAKIDLVGPLSGWTEVAELYPSTVSTTRGDDRGGELGGGLTAHGNGGDVGLGGDPTTHGDDDRLAAGQRDVDGAARVEASGTQGGFGARWGGFSGGARQRRMNKKVARGVVCLAARLSV
ncbi:hypothetical protein Droror1_Dr00008116 [Drosera rotundifolia]